MIFLPSIDLMDGQCVRLFQGLKEKCTVYAPDPAIVAAGFARDGADIIHVVDLDAAFAGAGAGRNRESIARIVAAAGIPVEVGGGVRSMADIESLLELGVARVIIGTAAIKNPVLVQQAVLAYGAERILVSIDAEKGMVAIKGWEEKTAVTAEHLANEVRRMRVTTVIYTDIQRDGTMAGPNFGETQAFAEKTALNIIASGGISSLDDVRMVLKLEPHGVKGFITGRGLYDGTFTVRDIVALMRGT